MYFEINRNLSYIYVDVLVFSFVMHSRKRHSINNKRCLEIRVLRLNYGTLDLKAMHLYTQEIKKKRVNNMNKQIEPNQ